MVHADQFLNGGTLKIREDTMDRGQQRPPHAKLPTLTSASNHEDDPAYKALMSLAEKFDNGAKLLDENSDGTSSLLEAIIGTMQGCATTARSEAIDRMIEIYA